MRLPYNIVAYRGHRKDYKSSHRRFDLIVRGPGPGSIETHRRATLETACPQAVSIYETGCNQRSYSAIAASTVDSVGRVGGGAV